MSPVRPKIRPVEKFQKFPKKCALCDKQATARSLLCEECDYKRLEAASIERTITGKGLTYSNAVAYSQRNYISNMRAWKRVQARLTAALAQATLVLYNLKLRRIMLFRANGQSISIPEVSYWEVRDTIREYAPAGTIFQHANGAHRKTVPRDKW
jgi:hypothetical protein